MGIYKMLFGYGLFACLYLLFGDRVHYLLILVVSHIVNVTNAYHAYRLFVFRDGRPGLRSYLRFHSVYLASLGFNLIALPFFVEVLNVSPILSQGFVLVITVVMSYVLHKRFSFG